MTRKAFALELKVNGQRARRLEPTLTNGAVNVIAGSAGNYVSPGVVGAVIGGGGRIESGLGISLNAANR